MATKRQKTEVGIFLVTALAILAAVVVSLSGVHRRRLDTYYVEFEETVAGLTEGSRVNYRGVPVGKILDLRVTPENKVGVTIGVDPAKVTLRKGVKARYSLQSVFGPYVIDLSGGTDPEAPLLEPGSFVPVQSSLLVGLEETFAETVPLALQRATKLLERLDTVFSKVKPEDLPALFHHADEALSSAKGAVEDLRDRTGDVAAALEKAVRAAQDGIEDAARRVGPAVEKLQASTGDVAERTSKLLEAVQVTIEENRKPLADSLKRFDDTLAKLNRQLDGLELPATTKSIREAADGVGKGADSIAAAAKSIAAGRDDVRRSLGAVERDLTRALEDLDAVLRSARDLLDTLDRDPSAIIRGKRP